MKYKNKLSTGYLWNAIGTALNSFSSLFYLIIVTRINGIEISGVFSYCYAFTLIIYTIINYGGRNYQLSDLDKEYKDSEYINSRFVTSFISIIICVLSVFLMRTTLEKIIIIGLFVIIRIVEGFSDSIYAVFQKKNHLDFVGKSLIIKNIASIILFLIIDLITKNILLSVIGIIISTLLTYCLYDKRSLDKLEYIKMKFSFKKTIQIMRTTLYFCLFNLVIILLSNIPRFFVEGNFSKEEIGYFGIIIMIPSIMLLLGNIILQPLIINITDSYNEKNYNEFRRIIKNMFLNVIGITIICMLCAYFLGPFVLKLTYNISFESYRGLLLVVLLAGMFNVFTTYLSNVLTIMRYTKEQFFLYMIILLINILILYFGTKYSFNFVFISYLICTMFQALLFLIYFFIKYKTSKI